MFSVDGVGKKDEYIRTGTIWEEKVRNMKNMALLPKVKISFSTTAQLLNIGYLNEVHDFVYDTFNIKPRLNNGLTFPVWARAVNIPKDIADSYIEKYKPLYFYNKKAHIKTLMNDKERNHSVFLRGIYELSKLDKRRNTNLLDEYPEFEEYYQ